VEVCSDPPLATIAGGYSMTMLLAIPDSSTTHTKERPGTLPNPSMQPTGRGGPRLIVGAALLAARWPGADAQALRRTTWASGTSGTEGGC
jgi:hypothetical protein